MCTDELIDVERLTRSVWLPVTATESPPGLTETFALHPGVQPLLFVSHHSAPVPRKPFGLPIDPRGTQKPPVNCELMRPGKIAVSFVKPAWVNRICAPPSTV